MSMSKIALAMIVKNESNIIIDTLENIRKHIEIDYYCICDTGSTDNTFNLVNEYLKENKLNGKIYKKEWVDFSSNRNDVLNNCPKEFDYVLNWDADDRFIENNTTINKSNLTEDVYLFKCISDKSTLYKTVIFRNKKDIRFMGKVHEFLDIPKHYGSIKVTDFVVRIGHFGARNVDRVTTEKKDLNLLVNALKDEKNPRLILRYCFYAARGYSNLQDYKNAVIYFQKYINYAKNLGSKTDIYADLVEFPKSYFLLASSYMILGDLEKSKNVIEQSLQKFGFRYEVSLLLARVEFRLGNLDKSYKLVNELIYINYLNISDINIDFIHASYFDFIFVCQKKSDLEKSYQILIYLLEKSSLPDHVNLVLAEWILYFLKERKEFFSHSQIHIALEFFKKLKLDSSNENLCCIDTELNKLLN